MYEARADSMRKRATEKMDTFKEIFFDNWSYKLVALFISLILWLTILGRRDFVVNKDIEVDFSVADNFMVSGQSTDKVRIKLSGPQPLLKKYKEVNQSVQISLNDKGAGLFEVEITPSKIEVPPGIKILSVKPSQIRVEITAVKN
ncbi:MAG: CdaR family protein [Pseudobdellovibrio sp.]